MKKMLTSRKKGFTMVEIIIVLVILAILIGASVPALLQYVDQARAKALLPNARAGMQSAQATVSELVGNGSYTMSNTDITKCVSEYNPVVSSTTIFTSKALLTDPKFTSLLDAKEQAYFIGVKVTGEGKVVGVIYDTGTWRIRIEDGVTDTEKNTGTAFKTFANGTTSPSCPTAAP